MSIALTKGQSILVTHRKPSLEKIAFCLGWDSERTLKTLFDLDLSAFLLMSNGKVESDEEFIYYNNLYHYTGCLTHMGDDRFGWREGDDEVIAIDLPKIPRNIAKIAFSVTFKTGRQTFGQLDKAFFRIVDFESRDELCRCDFEKLLVNASSAIAGELYRTGSGWAFACQIAPIQGTLADICRGFDVRSAAL